MSVLLQEIERPEIKKSFDTIPYGNCFMYNGKIYFKIQEYKLDRKDDGVILLPDKINAVCINESRLTYFIESAMVIPIEVELNYYK